MVTGAGLPLRWGVRRFYPKRPALFPISSTLVPHPAGIEVRSRALCACESCQIWIILVDLFSNRILKASDLKKELDIKDSQEPVSWPQDESAAKQLKIFKELLDSLKPKAVLVANALASHILIKEMRLEGTKKGYSSLPSSNVLIFFSSTFSGGHLDVFSRRRLEDQIIRVVKNL
jgi:hypothetical protein